MENIILESERLFLKPLSRNELSDIINKKAIETPIDKSSLSDAVLSAITKKIIKMEYIDAKLINWYTYWLIINKDSGNGIGFIGFKGISLEGYAEVGYSISPDYRKKRLMTEALVTLIDWSRKNQHLKGISANVHKTNIGSVKVLENCNFKLTGSSDAENFYCLNF